MSGLGAYGEWARRRDPALRYLPGRPGRYSDSGKLQRVWQRINDKMSDRWGPVEFKESNFVIDPWGNAVLVDCGGAVRRGENLLNYALWVADGIIDDPDADNRGGENGESYLRWSLRMDAQDDRISEKDAARAIAALDIRFGAPKKRNPSSTRKPYVPCPRGIHQAALENDVIWNEWPLVSRQPDMGIETRRCPACGSTQSRLLEENPRRRQKRFFEVSGQRDDTEPGELSTMILCETCLPTVDDFFIVKKKRRIASDDCDRCGRAGEDNPGPHKIKLTKGEKEAAAWAIDPMEEFWQEQVSEGEVDEMPPLPVIEGSELVLPDHEDVIDDFLYRIEDQLADMSEDEAGWRVKTTGAARESVMAATVGVLMRPARNLAKKIRAAAGREE